MTTSLLEARNRQHLRRARQPAERGDWACDNCQAENTWPRKRCTDCGTSRY